MTEEEEKKTLRLKLLGTKWVRERIDWDIARGILDDALERIGNEAMSESMEVDRNGEG